MRNHLIDRNPVAHPNWTGSDWTHPAVVVTPESEDDLVEVIADPDQFPSPVRAVGHLHSTNPCFSTNELGTTARQGTLVLMRPRSDYPSEGAFCRVEVFEGRPLPELPHDVYVRAGAGARMIDIRNALGNPWRRELAVSPEIGNATAGSVACGGTKDSTLRPRDTPNLSQISSLVVEAKFVDANGNRIRVDESGAYVIAQRGQLLSEQLDLRKFRSSYGLCGIVYEVTFRTTPLVPIETRYQWIAFDGAPRPRPDQIPTVESILAAAKGRSEAETIDGFLQPYEGGMLVERRRRVRGATITTDDLIRRAVRDWVWEWGASQATTAATAIAGLHASNPRPAFQQLVSTAVESALASTLNNPLKRVLATVAGGYGYSDAALLATLQRTLGMSAGSLPDVAGPADALWQLVRGYVPGDRTTIQNQLLALFGLVPRAFFTTGVGGFTGYRSDSMIDFAPPTDRETCFDFTFWAYPLDRWQEIVAGYLAFCHDHYERTGFRPSLFTEIYFMGHDTTSLLSPCANGAMFTLDTVHSGPKDPEWTAFNELYNVWAAEHGGRPLLNQTKNLESTPDVTEARLREAFGDEWATYSTRVLQRAFDPAEWAAFTAMVRQANPPLPRAPNGRFVSAFFQCLLTRL